MPAMCWIRREFRKHWENIRKTHSEWFCSRAKIKQKHKKEAKPQTAKTSAPTPQTTKQSTN